MKILNLSRDFFYVGACDIFYFYGYLAVFNMASDKLEESIRRFSVLVNKGLDLIGYHNDQIKFRAQQVPRSYQTAHDTMNGILNLPVDVLVAGSRAEGVPFHSDLDLQLVYRTVVCLERGHCEEGLTVLETDFGGCPPGYTRLRVYRIEPDILGLLIDQCLVEKERLLQKETFLSSLKFLNVLCRGLSQTDTHLSFTRIADRDTNGPAFSFKLNFENPFLKMTYFMDVDAVPALSVHLPRLLDEWANRKREHDWPPADVINDVASTVGVVVPVSLKESKHAQLEWRICLTQADNKLLASFSESQIKLYVLLKMVKRDIIDKVSSGLTSFMLKNVVCWMCEGLPSTRFTPEHHVYRLRNALYFLRECLLDSHLPCYMIPQRNLLIGKLEDHNKYKITKLLSDILTSNGGYLLQCGKLLKGMSFVYRHPGVSRNAVYLRNRFERLLLYVGLKMALKPHVLLHKDSFLLMFYEVFADREIFETMCAVANTIGIENLWRFLSPRTNTVYLPVINEIMML